MALATLGGDRELIAEEDAHRRAAEQTNVQQGKPREMRVEAEH